MSENMIFCLGEGRLESKGEGYQKNNRIFNKEVSKEEFNKIRNSRPSFDLPIAIWRKKEEMTKEEKDSVSNWSQMGGYLKTLSYKDAWAEAWPKASDKFKKWVKELPNFSPTIFKSITGIEWKDDSLSGQEVKVKLNGKVYKAIIQ